jgi:hypothetical protein
MQIGKRRFSRVSLIQATIGLLAVVLFLIELIRGPDDIARLGIPLLIMFLVVLSLVVRDEVDRSR